MRGWEHPPAVGLRKWITLDQLKQLYPTTKENRMNEPTVAVPPVPPAPMGEPTPSTLIQTLNAKLKAAQAARAAADQVVKDLEDEIKALPKHLHDLTFADMMGKVDGWFK